MMVKIQEGKSGSILQTTFFNFYNAAIPHNYLQYFTKHYLNVCKINVCLSLISILRQNGYCIYSTTYTVIHNIMPHI